METTVTGLEGDLVLDVPEAVLALPQDRRREELREQVRQGFRLKRGGVSLVPDVTILDLGEGANAVDVVRVHFALPGPTREVTLSTSSELGDVAVELADKTTRTRDRAVIAAGGTRTLSLAAKAVSAPSAGAAIGAGESAPTNEPFPTKEPPRGATVPWVEYLSLGFFHIVPAGVDHLLFLLSLVLLIKSWLPLLALLSLFTLGHAVSVVLGVYGMANIDPAWVEPLIALSIAYAALEARRPALAWLRPYLVSLFGLVHGLGFARALLHVGVAEDQRWAAIASFNLGVELGQLTVAVPVFALLSLLARRGQGTGLRMRGLYVLAAIGIGWAALRLLGFEV